VALLSLLCACNTPRDDPGTDRREPAAMAEPIASGATLPSWSSAAWPAGATRRDAITLELRRDGAEAGALLDLAAAGELPPVDAARTLARIGAADAPTRLLALFERSDRAPSAAELAAAGLLEPPPGLPGEAREPEGPWQTLERELWARYAVDDDVNRMLAVSFALARLGGAYSQAMWAVELAEPDPEAVRRVAVLEAIGIACTRRHRLHTRTLPPLAEIVEGPASPVRTAAIYALARCAAPSAESFAGPERAAWVERLAKVLAQDGAEDGALAWKALAGLGEISTPIPAGILAASAPSWEVEVEAVRALAGHPAGRLALVERLVRLEPATLRGTRVSVVSTALQSLRKPVDASPELAASLRPWAERVAALAPADARHATELALLRCESLALQAIADGKRALLERCAEGVDGLPPHYGAVLEVEVIASSQRALTGSARADALLASADDRRAPVAEAAISALADLDDARVSSRLRSALGSTDVGVLAAAAGAIAARAADRDTRDPEAVVALEAMLGRVHPQHAIEARLSAIEALGAMARSAGASERGAASVAVPAAPTPQPWLERTILPLASDPNDAIRRAAWTALDGMDELRTRFSAAVPTAFPEAFAAPVHAALDEPPATGLRIHTELGTIVIDFAGAPAPIAQASLVALARAGRFDGLRFHRVVPGFVAQGGDPRGDGYGGPGWVLPCEWSELRYERGTVGIALAGKDTGGSQFFIAHARQPHLDGRFTVIGHVSEGLELVDRILPHERIDHVEAIDP
jgi:cyclophilin family peptidyl-prolyl cis-trans isomerase